MIIKGLKYTPPLRTVTRTEKRLYQSKCGSKIDVLVRGSSLNITPRCKCSLCISKSEEIKQLLTKGK